MTQLQRIKEQINSYGSVSRNWSIKNYIYRLGAITNLLNKQGYNLIGSYEKTDTGLDYIYRNKPKLAYPYKEKPIPKETYEQKEKLL